MYLASFYATIISTRIRRLTSTMLMFLLVAGATGYTLPDPTPGNVAVPSAVESTQETLIEDYVDDTEPHTIHFPIVDEAVELEDSQTISFPLDSGPQATKKRAGTALSCNPVEYGTPVTTTKTVPVIAIISVFDPPFPVKTSETRESTTTIYGMDWLAPNPGIQNELTINGIDVDRDCVRDDVENHIYQRLSGVGNIRNRKYLYEYAKWMGKIMSASPSETEVRNIYLRMRAATNCLAKSVGESQSEVLLKDVFTMFLNTLPRIHRHRDNILKIGGWSPRSLPYETCQ